MSEHSKLPYIVEEAYTDNGMVIHYNILDKHGLRVAQSEHKCHAQLIVDSVNGVKGYKEALELAAKLIAKAEIKLKDKLYLGSGEAPQLLEYEMTIARNALKADNQ